jgi:endoglucanase
MTRLCILKRFTAFVLCFGAYATAYAQSDSPFIIVDQFGYLPGAPKIAVIKDPQAGFDSLNYFTPGSRYAVVNAVTGDTVFSGSPVSWKNGMTDPSSGDRAWHFNFSEVTANGSYYVVDVENKISSYPFSISPSVYNEVLRQAMRTFFYQRAGFAKEEPYAEPAWADGASHMGPGQDPEARRFNAASNPATARDVSGGWYDAGDYNKYTRWNADYIVVMMQAYRERPEVWTDDFNIPESGNGIPDILDEAKWGLDHLLRMQNEDGSVLSVVGVSHASPPSAATGPSRYGLASTSATSGVSAAFAIASGVYRSIGMDAFAGLLEERAIAAWEWADANPNVIFRNNDPAYGSSGLAAGQQETNDYGRLMEKLRAACFLFELTGDTRYREFFDANYNKVNMFAWNFAFPFQARNQDFLIHYTTVDGATPQVVSHIKQVYGNAMMNGSENWPAITGKKDPYMAHLKDYTWGSNGVKCLQGSMFYSLYQYNFNLLDSTRIANASIGYINYIHGVNPLNFIYLSNMFRYGANNGVREFYHTWFSNGSRRWDRVGVSDYGPAPGFLTGGPNPSYNWDGCCPSGCGSTGNNQMCHSESIYPPKGQPDQKSYKDFNTSWPLNSWSVTENSLGYQLPYIRLLSKFVNPGYDCKGDLHGEAFYDACGVCSGGNTGRIPSADPGDCAMFALDVSAENGTVWVPSNDELFANGRIIRITATADDGYLFRGWSGHASGKDNPLTIVMNVDKKIIANFALALNLNVEGGSGSGEYYEGARVRIKAGDPPRGHIFDRWDGDAGFADNNGSSSTMVTMPGKDITLTAVYRALNYSLTVDQGTGSGEYPMGAEVEIEAASPSPKQIFDRWTGDTDHIENVYAGTTSLVMPDDNITVSATYAPLFTLSVYPGSGGGDYREGAEVVIEAEAPPAGEIFDRWTGDTESIAHIDSIITTIIMPASDISVTATYMADTITSVVIHPDESGQKLSLHPNPATREVKLTAKGFRGETVVSIIDINGTVMRQELLGHDGELVIETAFLPKGTYIVRVASQKKIKHVRLVLI